MLPDIKPRKYSGRARLCYESRSAMRFLFTLSHTVMEFSNIHPYTKRYDAT